MTLNIKTSNYARAGKNAGAVAISVTVPDGRRGTFKFTGPTYPALVPPPCLVKAYKAGEITTVEYVTRYDHERLSLLDPNRVVDDLLTLAAPHAPVLLCWCGRNEFCHRNIVSAWLRAAGIRCEELR